MTRRAKARERRAYNRARRRQQCPLGESLRHAPWSDDPDDYAWFSARRRTARQQRIVTAMLLAIAEAGDAPW